MKISLIIPAHNEEKYISDCLKSVLENGKELSEVIVINNASTDKTAEIAGSFGGVKVITELSKGLTKARQRGLKESTGDILAFVDADTKMPKGWVEKINKAFEANPRLACLSGPYIYYDLSVSDRLLVWLYWHLFAYGAYLLVGYMAVGGNFAARRDALEKIGGFDENISFYGEDTNIARRLNKTGKVKFTHGLYMYTSARRLKDEGLINMTFKYTLNFLSEVFRGKPLTKEYKDIR